VLNQKMPFSVSTQTVGTTAGPKHGLRRLVVQVQPVAPDEVACMHRHDGDQILRVLEGEVFMEIAGEARICRAGEMGIAPAGAAHGFRGVGAPALLEVLGEQACGTVFLLEGGESVEVHRPEVPWDRPGEPTDIDAVYARALVPREP
jgi:quercetin dioxygenase-like cupin family protein